MEISLLLFEEKIKIKIKEIQDYLENNPLMYENSFEFKQFGGLADYYINKGGIESIFEFLVKHFEGKKDIIEKEANAININVKFQLGDEEESLSMKILEKKIGLEKTLKNIDKSFKEIKKENIKIKEDNVKTKEEFKKNLLEKVYPIGSYYWSDRNISPENIFGGKWEKINGRFLFASDCDHSLWIFILFPSISSYETVEIL